MFTEKPQKSLETKKLFLVNLGALKAVNTNHFFIDQLNYNLKEKGFFPYFFPAKYLTLSKKGQLTLG